MKWIIKNPSPLDYRQKMWGDYHIGRSLTKYLTRLGENVETDYDGKWNNKKKADVILVLRGKYPYKPRSNAKLHIMWNYGHPEDVSIKEYESYDIILVASNQYADVLKKKISKPVYPFLLCTDPEEFYINNKDNDMKRKGIIFVGNTRGVKRECISWAIEYAVPLKIWGRGWEKWIDKKYVVDKYIPNKKLSKLYSKSKATLNNHWPDMIKYGFVNNRVFDALACGLPIISDYSEELFNLFPNEILYYRSKNEFKKCIERLNSNYKEIKDRVNSVIPRIISDFSCGKRASDLLKIVKKHL